MYQVPLQVWNQIAASQPLYPPMRELMLCKSPQELAAMVDKHLDHPAAQAHLDNKTTLAFRLTLPLLLENEAISAYIAETGQQDLRTALPELTNLREALQLAAMEYRLTQSQLVKLHHLLHKHANAIATQALTQAPA